jgi:uncharacterized protein (UPF0276 family)
MLDLGLPFAKRVASLPQLGLGMSTELGARPAGGLDVAQLRRAHPGLVQFLEIGADLARGFDSDTAAWIGERWPTTYHFLDGNLEETESLSPQWIEATAAQARAAGAAWLCGDAGLWHLGPRDRGHGVLMPPILTRSSAQAMAENVRRVREQSGFEVLPENPPAHLYLGDLHILEYFARVAEGADCGLLLDVAHLAIYQHVTGHTWSDALDQLPLERVVEIHAAGGSLFEHRGRSFVDDDHSPEPLEATWQILDWVLPRAPELRALVYEGERNGEALALPRLQRLAERLDARGLRGRREPPPEPALAP